MKIFSPLLSVPSSRRLCAAIKVMAVKCQWLQKSKGKVWQTLINWLEWYIYQLANIRLATSWRCLQLNNFLSISKVKNCYILLKQKQMSVVWFHWILVLFYIIATPKTPYIFAWCYWICAPKRNLGNLLW